MPARRPTTDIPAEGGQEVSGTGVWERTGEEGLGLGLVSTHVRFGSRLCENTIIVDHRATSFQATPRDSMKDSRRHLGAR
jgi:hypothetical protein